MNKIAVMALILLMGCASAHKALSDGSHSVSCKRSIENCYEKALEVCPGGYATANSVDESSLFTANGQVYTAKNYNMLIRCKASPSG